MEYSCDICGSTFTQKYNLVAHQKGAKYCIAMREGKPNLPMCEYCSKTFGTKQRLSLHAKICVPRLQTLLKEKDIILEEAESEGSEKIRELETKYGHQLLEKNAEINRLKDELYTFKLKMAKIEAGYDIYEKEYRAIRDKPTTTNYNTITKNKLKLVNTSTIEPFTLDNVKKRLTDSGYTYDMFLQGAMGVKKFILGMITKDEEKSYVSTDTNRKNFHRLEMAKKWVDDKGAVFLTKVFDEMKPLTLEYFGRFHEEIGGVDSCDVREENDKVLDKIMPVIRAINHPEHKDRKTLQDEIVRYIKPYVSI